MLDALISHLYVLFWSERNAPLRNQKPNNNITASSSTSSDFSAASGACELFAFASPEGNTTAVAALNTSAGSVASAAASAVSTSSEESNAAVSQPNDELCRDLLAKLLDALDRIRECTFRAMADNLHQLDGSDPLLESLLALSGENNTSCAEISALFTESVSTAECQTIMFEWRDGFLDDGDVSFASAHFPVEYHTLTVVEAHVAEICRHANYSVLQSLKHTFKSIVYLIYYLLPASKDDVALLERCKRQLVDLLYDIRCQNFARLVDKCLQSLDGYAGSEAYQLLTQTHVLRHTYRLLIDYAELSADRLSGGSQQQQQQPPRRPPFVPESIVHMVLGVWEAMLDRPSGLRAMHEFFAVQQSGSLIRVLLSFTGTALSQSYATRVLQFFEKLFDVCEDQPSAPFPRDSLCASLSDLGHTEASSLKLWLSHILLGPGPANSALSPTSATSSNVPTPTNMAATVSAAAPTSSGTDQSGGGGGGIGAADDDIMSDMDFISAAWRAATTATTTTGQQSELDATTTAATQPGGVGAPDDQSAQQNARLLLQLTKNIVGDARIMPSVSQALFQALIQLGHNLLSPVHYQHHILGGESMEFGDLLQVMITLADASQGRGHATLFAAAVEWLEVSRQQVLDHNATVHRTNQINERSAVAVENVAALLRYMCDLLQGLGFAGGRTEWPQWEDDRAGELEDDESGAGHAVVYQHHHQHSSAGGATNVGGSSGATGGSGAGLAEEEDSTVEDSDEDGLSGKLCTYTTTQKEFMNQHWYHCHTCKMVDGVGVCSVCARVCHKNHDLSYAKFGNFFCDCGAKEDGSCQALTQRVAAHADAADAECSGIGRRSDALSHSPQSANSDQTVVTVTERSQQLSPMLEATRDTLRNSDQWRTVIGATLDFFEQVLPAVKENCARYSSVGCHQRAKNALERLHRPDKQFAFTDQLMLATLGSQEGAFENVRSNYAGEQAQTIRQLIATHMVRRIGLCCLSSPHGRRQHLAVAHEKGKVTILQLSALLKQADAAKKKLTLSRLSSAPIPCTIMSLAANPANEDLLAVCGLKECHVLTFSAAGAASSHIVVTPQLESGNFIKRAVWLPGSQTKLALITCDYVKVYELSEDAYSPQYYFVVPSGKIRDCTFVYQAGTYSLLLFASSGYIYTQPLVDESLAKHGAFYVTNTLDIDHPYVYELKGALCEGGAAIYYSHLLQMLFFSYVNGRNFMAPLSDVSAGVKCVVQLQRTPAHSPTPASGASHSAPATSAASGAAAAAGGGGGGSAKPPSAGGSTGSQKTAATPQALVQWTEVVGHPGLIFALQNHSNNPVVIMLKPDGVLMQEIKYNNTKSKIIDMVAIRHTTGGQERTTLLLLCEDGSLRIFAANPRETSFWLSPEVQPLASEQYSNMIYARSGRRTKRSNSRAAPPPNGVAVALRAPGAGATGPVVVAPSNGVGSAAVAAAAAAALPPPPPPQAQPAVHFPVDYFEHCNFLSDVDFGGNDLLQVYNTQQLKHRLNATGLFVASSRASGFTLEVSSPDPAMVLTGVRVQFGTQDPARAPQSVSVLGRTVHTPTTRSRWFDMPLTRDESIQCNGRLHLVFGPSLDPDGICMLDSVKVYGRTKEDFGWPDDTSDTDAAGTAVAAGGGGGGGTAVGGAAGGAAGGDVGGGNNMAATHSYVGGYYGDAAPYAITGLDRMITATLELMDSALSLLGGPQADDTLKVRSQNLATLMLLYPLPLAVQNQSKAVLATLLGYRTAYNAFKDAEMVLEVNSELKTLAEVRDIANIDPEAFFRLIGITRSIAVARPQSLAQIVSEHQFNIVPAAMQMMQQLFAITPNYELQSSIVRSGLAHTEATVHCLVEIIYAFAVADAQTLPAMTAYLCQLLLNESPQISHSAKSALIRLLRPRGSGRRRRGAGSASGGGATAGGMIGSPPACSTPTPGTEEGGSALAAPMQAAGSAPAAAAANQGAAAGAANVAAAAEFAAALQDIDAIDQQFGGAGGVRRSVEAFLGIGLGARAPGGGAAAAADDVGGYQNLAQADEAAIMEIAIALSLQEGVGGGGQPGEFQALQQELANLHGVGQALRALHGDAMGGGANGGGAGGGGAGGGGAGAAANGNEGGAGAAAANA